MVDRAAAGEAAGFLGGAAGGVFTANKVMANNIKNPALRIGGQALGAVIGSRTGKDLGSVAGSFAERQKYANENLTDSQSQIVEGTEPGGSEAHSLLNTLQQELIQELKQAKNEAQYYSQLAEQTDMQNAELQQQQIQTQVQMQQMQQQLEQMQQQTEQLQQQAEQEKQQLIAQTQQASEQAVSAQQQALDLGLKANKEKQKSLQIRTNILSMIEQDRASDDPDKVFQEQIMEQEQQAQAQQAQIQQEQLQQAQLQGNEQTQKQIQEAMNAQDHKVIQERQAEDAIAQEQAQVQEKQSMDFRSLFELTSKVNQKEKEVSLYALDRLSEADVESIPSFAYRAFRTATKGRFIK